MLKKDLIKIEIKKPNLSFSEREKFFNTEIQKIMEKYNSLGFIVLEHKTINKGSTSASIEFSLKKMASV